MGLLPAFWVCIGLLHFCGMSHAPDGSGFHGFWRGFQAVGTYFKKLKLQVPEVRKICHKRVPTALIFSYREK